MNYVFYGTVCVFVFFMFAAFWPLWRIKCVAERKKIEKVLEAASDFRALMSQNLSSSIDKASIGQIAELHFRYQEYQSQYLMKDLPFDIRSLFEMMASILVPITIFMLQVFFAQ